MGKKWDNLELEIINLEYGNKSIKELSIILNRSCSSIVQKAKTLGLKSKPFWAKSEIQILQELNGKKTLEEFEQLLNRTKVSIKQKLKELGLYYISNRWTEKELKLLKELYYNKVPLKQIAEKLNRTVSAVKIKRRKLINANRVPWTKDEENLLQQKYVGSSKEELEELFNNRTYCQICRKAQLIELKQLPSRQWPPFEEELLRKNYPNMLMKELMLLFPNQTKTQIRNKAKTLKLYKTIEILNKCLGASSTINVGKKNKWRRTVILRDKVICQECYKQFDDDNWLLLQAHHIIPRRDINCEKYNPDNGICLCINCHNKIKDNEYEYIEKFNSIVMKNKESI